MGTPGSAVEHDHGIVETLTDAYPDQVRDDDQDREYPCIRFDREILLELMEDLRDEHGYEMLSDLTGADFPERDPRLEVIYNLYDMEGGNRLIAVTAVPEDDPFIESVTPLWKAARWYEREVYDMFGVKFKNHPQHRRMLLYEEFEGHPLRKDYPKKKRQPLPMYYERDGESQDPLMFGEAPSFNGDTSDDPETEEADGS